MNGETIQLHHKMTGEGQSLVILHGLFGCLDNWHRIAKDLSSDYRVITVDLRNHGRSPHHDQFDIATMAEDVRELMKDESPYIVMGHSMGGKVAMSLALNHPERVDKLVVVDMAPRAYPAGHEEVFEALESVNFDGVGTRQEIEEQLKQTITDQGVRLFLMKNLTRNNQGGFRWKMNLPVIRSGYPSLIQGLTSENTFAGPTLFIKGQRSNYLTQEDENLVKDLFPQSKMVSVDSGHWVHAEAPEAFLRVTREFLA